MLLPIQLLSGFVRGLKLYQRIGKGLKIQNHYEHESSSQFIMFIT
jgi:hypothetical protein